MAVHMRAMPEPIRTQFQVNANSYPDGNQLRAVIEEYLSATRTWALDNDGGSPMEVDYVGHNGTGKKGKSRGKGQDRMVMMMTQRRMRRVTGMANVDTTSETEGAKLRASQQSRATARIKTVSSQKRKGSWREAPRRQRSCW